MPGVAEYVSGLEKQNKLVRQGFDNQIVGRYSGSRERSRMQDNNDIQQDFASRQDDLLNQLQSGDIDQSLYDKKRKKHYRILLMRDLRYRRNIIKSRMSCKMMVLLVLYRTSNANRSINGFIHQHATGWCTGISTLTDMIINWAETGKLNVKRFCCDVSAICW